MEKGTPPTGNNSTPAVQVTERTSELEQSLSLVRATLEATVDGILIVSKDGHIVDCNQKFISMWQIPKEVMESGDEMRALQFVLDQVVDPDRLYKLVTRLNDNIEEKGDLGEIDFKDGRVFERYSQPHRVGDHIVGRVWSFRDVTERKRAEDALRLQERAIDSSPNGIIITDVMQTDNPIIYVNPAFARITGYKREEVIGKNCRFLQGLDRDQNALRRLRLAMQEFREESVVIKNYRRDGSLFWNQLNIAPVFDPSGKVRHFVGIAMDISNQKALEEQLLHQATHDALTGLPNRSLLADRIEQAMIQARRTGLKIGVLFLDLDRFKIVNDGLGHIIGDRVLKNTAERLLRSVREGDTVARMGGDEFIVVFPAVESEEQVFEKAQSILDELSKSVQIDGKEISLTTSIGVSFYPKDGEDVSALLRSADMSMYFAKEQGRNNFKSYTSELNRKVTHRMDMENHLRSALERHEFLIYYQPLVNLETHKIFGLEALIRWVHPELGLVAPQEFISIAEEDGLVIPIGKWVLQNACIQLKKWHDSGFKGLCISVNLSGLQLHQPDVIETVSRAIQNAQIEPQYLELEITESTLLENTEETIEKLHQLKEVGVRLSIDDFGTGYSSLSYLKQFPVHKLKIDRSFIQDLTSNENNASIAVAIINLGHSLKLKVLAEGVETDAQLSFLQVNNCDEAQGYYFAQPSDAESSLVLLKNKFSHEYLPLS